MKQLQGPVGSWGNQGWVRHNQGLTWLHRTQSRTLGSVVPQVLVWLHRTQSRTLGLVVPRVQAWLHRTQSLVWVRLVRRCRGRQTGTCCVDAGRGRPRRRLSPETGRWPRTRGGTRCTAQWLPLPATGLHSRHPDPARPAGRVSPAPPALLPVSAAAFLPSAASVTSHYTYKNPTSRTAWTPRRNSGTLSRSFAVSLCVSTFAVLGGPVARRGGVGFQTPGFGVGSAAVSVAGCCR